MVNQTTETRDTIMAYPPPEGGPPYPPHSYLPPPGDPAYPPPPYNPIYPPLPVDSSQPAGYTPPPQYDQWNTVVSSHEETSLYSSSVSYHLSESSPSVMHDHSHPGHAKHLHKEKSKKSKKKNKKQDKEKVCSFCCLILQIIFISF